MLLDLMKQNGVEKTVLIQVIHYRWDNRYAADTLKKYPQFFQAVCRVNPESPLGPRRSLETRRGAALPRCPHQPGRRCPRRLDPRPLMPPLWQRCHQLKVPMTVLAPVTRMPDVAKLIEKFPDLTVVIDHMADSPLNKPQELEKLLALQRYPKVFVKVSHTWSLSKEDYPTATPRRK